MKNTIKEYLDLDYNERGNYKGMDWDYDGREPNIDGEYFSNPFNEKEMK